MVTFPCGRLLCVFHGLDRKYKKCENCLQFLVVDVLYPFLSGWVCAMPLLFFWEAVLVRWRVIVNWWSPINCTDADRPVFTIVCTSLLIHILLSMSALPIDVALSSTKKENGDFVDALPSVSVNEAFVRAKERAESISDLACGAKTGSELLKLLTSYPFNWYTLLHSTALRVRFGWWVLRLSIMIFTKVVLF